MAQQQKRVAYIIRKRVGLETQLNRLEVYLEGQNVDSTNAKVRLDNLEKLYRKFLGYYDELTPLQASHPSLETFPEVESRYFEVASAVVKLQRVEPIANSTLNTGSIMMTERQDLPKLPEVKIPIFDGTREEWSNYKNKFIALVHSRTDISDSVKCSQLLNSLTGQAQAKVKYFDPSDVDYEQAWSTLLEFYDRKRIVAVEHLNALLDLPKLSEARADDLSMLVDDARQHLHILTRLGVRPGDDLVVRIIERCLPSAVHDRWQERLGMDELPELDDLFKFIQMTIFQVQASQSSSAGTRNNNRKRPGDDTSQPKGKLSKNVRSLVTTSTSSTSSAKPLTCSHCKGNHRLFKCPSFDKLSPSEHFQFVKSNKLCRNCLGSHEFPCKSDKRCMKCNQKHHISLHFKDNPQNRSSGPKLNSLEKK